MSVVPGEEQDDRAPPDREVFAERYGPRVRAQPVDSRPGIEAGESCLISGAHARPTTPNTTDQVSGCAAWLRPSHRPFRTQAATTSWRSWRTWRFTSSMS